MKALRINKSSVVDIIMALFMTLFFYAAIIKLFDYDAFRVQIGRSPLIMYQAPTLAWFVPTIEILAGILLFIPRTRMIGLYLCFTIMFAFTIYIAYMLIFSPTLPCSCGGILSKMGWTEHLIFNAVFTLLAITGIYLERKQPNNDSNPTQGITRISKFKPSTGMALCISLVILTFGSLYSFSPLNEEIYRGNFTRKINEILIQKSTAVLKEENAYISGLTNDRIFISSIRKPFTLSEYTIDLENLTTRNIRLDGIHSILEPIQFRTNVSPPTFVISNGVMPVLMTGSTSNWIAKTYDSRYYFDKVLALNSNSFILKSYSKLSKQMDLATLRQSKFEFGGILKKQIDGLIDVTGDLHYSKSLKKALYVYTYRNEYLIIDSLLNQTERGNTLDTFKIVQLKLSDIKSRNSTMVDGESAATNIRSRVLDNHLLIQSNIMSSSENETRFRQSSIIDIYDIKSKKYISSFYIPNYKGKHLTDFKLTNKNLVALFDRDIVCYEFKPDIKLGKL